MFAYRRPRGKGLSRSRPLLEAPIAIVVREGGPRASVDPVDEVPNEESPSQALLPLAMAAIVLATVLTIPATAQSQRVTVQPADGTLQQWVVDAPDGSHARGHPQAGPPGQQPIAMEPAPPQTTPRPDRFPPGPQTARAPPAPAPPAEPQVNAQKPAAGDGHARSPRATSARRAAKAGRSLSLDPSLRLVIPSIPQPAPTPCAAPTAPPPRQPHLHRRAARPLDRDRGAQLHHPQVPGADLPAADLPGRGHPVRHPLGGARGDQRDRDRLRAQPQRVLRRRARLDAVHALHLAASTASTPTATARRTPSTRSTRSSPRPAT